MTVNINFKGGGSIINHKPVFSSDGENVFVSWKNSILEYNTKTGKLIHEYKGLNDRVAGFSFHDYETYQCITACSVKGQVLMWKAVTHFKMHEKKIHKDHIENFHIIQLTNESDLQALISYKENNKIHFSLINLINKEEEKISLQVFPGEYHMAVGSEYFCVVQKKHAYFIYFNKLDKFNRATIKSPRRFTCVACHPTEEIVITGDSDGRVIAWQELTKKKATHAIYHWHTLPVKTVSFSISGTYFYSGGDECVLVKWTLDNPSERSFVPRIAAPLQHITVSNKNLYIAVSTNDNAVRIFDARLYQISLIQHIVIGQQLNTGLIYDSRTKGLIMNGNVGYIQFYSPLDRSLMYNVDIVGENKITDERNCKMENTEVSKIAISKCGLWLATIEERIDEDFQSEVGLKFFHFNEIEQTFELNTSIDSPHNKSVTNILYQPLANDSNLKFVTVSKEHNFKIWQLEDLNSIYRKGVAWKCYSIGTFRDLPCSGLSFSIDGSLMAIGFGAILTTWVPENCNLKCSLVHPNYKEDITHVEFGRGNDCHLIVTTSKNHLNVWNLLSLNLIWTVSIEVSLLVADSLTTHMAVISQNRKVIVFTPASPTPIYINKKLKESTEIIAATFVPSRYSNDSRLNWCERSALYYIDSNKELFCLSKEDETSYSIEDEEYIEKSVFSKIQPSKQVNKVSVTTPAKHLYEYDSSHKDIKSFLDTPAQTMIPVRFMCKFLLQTLVLKKDSLVDSV